MSNVKKSEDSKRLRIGILGSGNIGTDLIYKVRRNSALDLRIVSGIDPASEGLARARELRVDVSSSGADAILEHGDVDVVLDATGAKAHLKHAPRLCEAGMRIIDLTPAKLGPSIVPCVNINESAEQANVNLISCAAQATIPLIYGFSRVSSVKYAEIISTIASDGAGLAARQNIEEFKATTEKAMMQVGGARSANAMVIFNPANPPIKMRNTVYLQFDDDVEDDVVQSSVMDIAARVQGYVPGYEVTVPPFRRDDHFMVSVEVSGAGDYLPTYAGNLDIINAAAISILERYAASARSN